MSKGARIRRTRQLQHDALCAEAVQTFSHFVRQAWPILEPGIDLDWNWHHEVICDELEVVFRGDVRELVINIPPGFMKSILVSVMFPAWVWLHRPWERLLSISNVDSLAVRDGRKQRQIVVSEWYQQLIKLASQHYGFKPWGLSLDQNEKTYFETTARGFRQNLGIGASIIGKRGDGLLVDDPYDAKSTLLGGPQAVNSRMTDVCRIYDDVLSSRLNDPRTGYRIVIMQRLHELDLAGHLLKRGVRCVVLPMEYDPNLCIHTPDGTRSLVHPEDPRTEAGELLHPLRHGPKQMKDNTMSARATASQWGQRPTAAEGGLFKRLWFTRRYEGDPIDMLLKMDERALSIDCNFKETKDGSFAIIQAWGREKKQRFYLLDQFRARCNYTDLKKAVRIYVIKWAPRFVLVENKALGDALIADLDEMCAEMGVAVIPYEPGNKSKYERAEVNSAPAFEALQIWLPDPVWCPWVDEYIEEHCAFPHGANDDQVDGTSQMLSRWTSVVNMSALERSKRLWG